ncbi:hypothetical protein [Nitrospira moscoviensis]|uniref:hypothetical protein n=1 Tax=Nitrospira moscoviensis TaxID=42253 RepID=UPI0011AE5767|nr:hypothetical protein [Nitrospira moscoviensis]
MGNIRTIQLLRSLLMATVCTLAGCGLLAPDVIPVKSGPEGAVVLERLASRGTTVRYSGPLKSFRAGHPVSISSDVVERVVLGIHVGIAPADGDGASRGIKPAPLFSAKETAFLAPAIAAALERAEPDQRVRFQVGPDSDRTAGTLYVDGGTIRLALSHLHASPQTKDEPLSIYVLSFKPEQAQEASSNGQRWAEIEPEQPRLAINYAALRTISSPATPPSTPALSSGDQRSMKEVVDQQAKELDALKAELEALKKRMQTQPAR